MKFLINKSAVLSLIAIVFCVAAKAQVYRTDVSIKDQIINNSVPGAVYADPNAPVKQTPAKGFTGSSLKKAIEEGKIGVPVKAPTGPVVQTPVVTRPAGVVLPSEVTAEQRQAELQKQAEANKIKPLVVPTQEVPVKEEKQPEPVKEN